MIAHERLQKIEKYIRRAGSVSFERLRGEFPVSPATLRRDLSALEAEGKVIRTHGGVTHPLALSGEPDFARKSVAHQAAKQKIAAAVNASVPDRAVLFIDGGTTCLESAKLLLARPSLSIFTNSVPLLYLAMQAAATVTGLGGELRKVSAALTGGEALNALDRLRADIALVGASALDGRQVYTSELAEASVKQAMMRRSRQSWLLADASKEKAAAPVAFAERKQFQRIVTEKN